MAEHQKKLTKSLDNSSAAAYAITWNNKPLGFSIVMDTTGKNAYVSSIQKASNKEKGLRLAAQIIKINKESVKNMEHKQILTKIKQASLPIELVFQPRSFANEPQSQNNEDGSIPTPLTFEGATTNQGRINGCFELVQEKYNGKHQWQRDDEETDPIILWWFPGNLDANTTSRNLWMISRMSMRNTESAYACCEGVAEFPTELKNPEWEIFNKTTQKFQKCPINIMQNQVD